MACILIADDEFHVSRSVSRLLSRAGYDCVLARDGEEALRLIRKERPALVFLDLDMPRLSGVEVLRQLNEDPELRQIPVCVLTALAVDEDLDYLSTLKNCHILPKPYDPTTLLQIASQALAENPGL